MPAMTAARMRSWWSGGKGRRVSGPAADDADGALELDPVGVDAGLGGGFADQGGYGPVGEQVSVDLLAAPAPGPGPQPPPGPLPAPAGAGSGATGRADGAGWLRVRSPPGGAGSGGPPGAGAARVGSDGGGGWRPWGPQAPRRPGAAALAPPQQLGAGVRGRA